MLMSLSTSLTQNVAFIFNLCNHQKCFILSFKYRSFVATKIYLFSFYGLNGKHVCLHFSVSSIASFIQTMDHRIFQFAPDGSA